MRERIREEYDNMIKTLIYVGEFFSDTRSGREYIENGGDELDEIREAIRRAEEAAREYNGARGDA
jgi:hypothetical protein